MSSASSNAYISSEVNSNRNNDFVKMSRNESKNS